MRCSPSSLSINRAIVLLCSTSRFEVQYVGGSLGIYTGVDKPWGMVKHLSRARSRNGCKKPEKQQLKRHGTGIEG